MLQTLRSSEPRPERRPGLRPQALAPGQAVRGLGESCRVPPALGSPIALWEPELEPASRLGLEPGPSPEGESDSPGRSSSRWNQRRAPRWETRQAGDLDSQQEPVKLLERLLGHWPRPGVGPGWLDPSRSVFSALLPARSSAVSRMIRGWAKPESQVATPGGAIRLGRNRMPDALPFNLVLEHRGLSGRMLVPGLPPHRGQAHTSHPRLEDSRRRCGVDHDPHARFDPGIVGGEQAALNVQGSDRKPVLAVLFYVERKSGPVGGRHPCCFQCRP